MRHGYIRDTRHHYLLNLTREIGGPPSRAPEIFSGSNGIVGTVSKSHIGLLLLKAKKIT